MFSVAFLLCDEKFGNVLYSTAMDPVHCSGKTCSHGSDEDAVHVQDSGLAVNCTVFLCPDDPILSALNASENVQFVPACRTATPFPASVNVPSRSGDPDGFASTVNETSEVPWKVRGVTLSQGKFGSPWTA